MFKNQDGVLCDNSSRLPLFQTFRDIDFCHYSRYQNSCEIISLDERI